MVSISKLVSFLWLELFDLLDIRRLLVSMVSSLTLWLVLHVDPFDHPVHRRRDAVLWVQRNVLASASPIIIAS